MVNHNNLVVQIYGATADIATQQVSSVHYPLMKVGFGASGGFTGVTDSVGLPVRMVNSPTAYIDPNGWVNVRGSSAGDPVTVKGSVGVYGVTGMSVTVTGGRISTKDVDSIKIWGSGGETYAPVQLFSAGGASAGFSGSSLKVWVQGFDGVTVTVGTTVSVTASTPLIVQGTTAGYPIAITGSSGVYLGITNPDIISGITAIYGQIVGLRSDMAAAGAAAPTSAYQYTFSLTALTTATFSSGFTCQKGINVKAHSTNTGLVWVGGMTASSLVDVGLPLDPGEQIFVYLANIDKIGFTSSTSGQKVSILAT